MKKLMPQLLQYILLTQKCVIGRLMMLIMSQKLMLRRKLMQQPVLRIFQE